MILPWDNSSTLEKLLFTRTKVLAEASFKINEANQTLQISIAFKYK